MNTKAFFADPQAPVRTTWAVIGFFIVTAFGAGSWATWMSFKMSALEGAVADIRTDIREMKNQNAISKHPYRSGREVLE